MRLGVSVKEVPHRTTVEQMARELGVLAQLQTAEAMLSKENNTLAFDATTQKGIHVNAVLVTSRSSCHFIAVDQLPGATAEDYYLHVTNAVNDIADVYSTFTNKMPYQECRKKLIDCIANTMTDRVSTNHASVALINEYWGKSLNELNCHLHPLDSMSTYCRSAMKKEEGSQKLAILGHDCVAGNLVLQFNKMRYKDGKGDPCGFIIFLVEKNLPRGILPRYRGNRLHILFHICGIFIQNYADFIDFLSSGAACGGLRKSILQDFQHPLAIVEMRILGLIGKFLTGPWMKKFYVSADNQTINYVEGIQVVKEVVNRINDQIEEPSSFVKRDTDFFGDNIDEND